MREYRAFSREVPVFYAPANFSSQNHQLNSKLIAY